MDQELEPCALNVLSAATPQLSILEIVQQKFKDFEKVHSIFEAYQIRRQEHASRLLALVSSIPGGTYAIISLSFRDPIRSCNDLVINKVFPLDQTFKLTTDSKSSVSQLQFDLLTGDEEPSKFYFYPIKTVEGAVDFEDFQAQIIARIMSVADWSLAPDSVLSFNWLNDYRQIGEVKQELKKRESEYIVYKDIKIYCATWNVNSKPYDNETALPLWLSVCDKPPDIYAIAFQELPITLNVNRPDTFWITKMLESLHPEGQYEELRTVRLVGMMLTVFVRRQLLSHISRCRLKTIPRGVFNTLGNKGGVAISMQLNEANICFVNSHLAAHMGYVEERNQDFQGIVAGVVFDDDLRRTINDHDHIFWIGDLNYRIQTPPGLQLPWPRDDLRAFLSLLKYDQLRQEMAKGKCFNGYTEGAITFRPTYKYDPGTDNFDSSEKQRQPAYCDRVLWKGSYIEQLSYNSVMDIRQSDHKPVYALFNVKIKTRDEKKYKRVQEEVLKAVDKRENDNQPQINVEKTVIDFGVVRFNEPATSDFTVSNSCPLPVVFKFKVKDPPLNDICEKWLLVEPREGNLMMDSARNIRVKLHADMHTISGLLKKIRTTNCKFDFDILILHVENGPDIFITVTGEYQPSCFGLSIETMCRTNQPLIKYNQEEIKQLMNDSTPEYRVSMPREFFLLIDYLHKQGPKLEGIFQLFDVKRKQHSQQFNAVRDWLDTWSTDEFPGNVQSAVEALILLLELPEEALLEPFVEQLLYSKSKAEAMEYIALLSAPKRNVFMHLCMFLRVGIEYNYYQLQHVAGLFGKILLRSNEYKTRSDYAARCSEFMQRFIATDTMETPARAQAVGMPATTTAASSNSLNAN